MPRSHESRVTGGKKSAITLKEKYGKDYHSVLGHRGGELSTPGYFGHLKATGQKEKILELQKKGAAARKSRSHKTITQENK